MGIRKSAQNRKARGVGGRGSRPVGPNNGSLRSVRRHIPLYVGIFLRPYCGQHRQSRLNRCGVEAARQCAPLAADSARAGRFRHPSALAPHSVPPVPTG